MFENKKYKNDLFLRWRRLEERWNLIPLNTKCPKNADAANDLIKILSALQKTNCILTKDLQKDIEILLNEIQHNESVDFYENLQKEHIALLQNIPSLVAGKNFIKNRDFEKILPIIKTIEQADLLIIKVLRMYEKNTKIKKFELTSFDGREYIARKNYKNLSETEEFVLNCETIQVMTQVIEDLKKINLFTINQIVEKLESELRNTKYDYLKYYPRSVLEDFKNFVVYVKQVMCSKDDILFNLKNRDEFDNAIGNMHLLISEGMSKW